MKVIIDTNLWISFLIGHQAQLVRRMLTDLRFDVYVCSRLIEEVRDVASRDKIRKYVSEADLGDLLAIINAFCQFATIEAEVAPTRTGYDFDGWKNGITAYDFTAAVTSDLTLTAAWTAIEYCITYNGIDGSTFETANPTKYTIEDAITLNNPSKTGYSFTGWTGSNGDTPQTSVTIAIGSHENKTYTANFRKLLSNADIAVADIPAQTYSGTALTPALTVTDGTTALTLGTDYTVSPETATDAGDYTVTLTGIGQYDGTATKTFTVSRRAVTLTSATDSKTYDGTALTADGVTVSGDGFAEGEGATYAVTGQQTTAGSSANTFAYTLTDGTKAANYDITTVEGTLTVTPLAGVTVTITGHTESKPYDGTEHTISDYDVEISSQLYTEDDFTFSGTAEASRTDAGTTGMGLAADQFENTNANFEGVTFSVTDGSMTITPMTVIVPTAATGLIYTGSEQTGVAGGEGYTVTGGTATAAGDHTATATLNDASNYQWSDQTTEPQEIAWSIAYYAASLADDADNAAELTNIITHYGGKANVTLQGRTLWKDGKWNTLCLPFDVDDFTGTPLENAVVKTLVSSGFQGGTLTMNFTEDKDNLTRIEAGKPYIVKWTEPASYVAYDGSNADECSDIVNPVFLGVTVSSTAAASETEGSEWVDFVGTYKPATIYESGTEKHNLYLGAANTLYYPTTEGFQVNACRAYFVLKNGLTAGEPADPQANAVRAFTLNFGDEETAIKSLSADAKDFSDGGAWYTLDGRRLSGKPTKSGIYVNGGRKVVIK